MQFLTTVALLASAVAAVPATLQARGDVCPSGALYSVLQCCSTDVLGLADLSCENPTSTPSDAADAQKICGGAGASAMCCTIPAATLGVLCNKV